MSELVRSYKLEVESIGGLNAGSYEMSVSGYGTSPYLWFYSEKGKRFNRILSKKVECGDSRKFVSVPTYYKGKRLTKHEALFLLNAHREWGGYATGSLDRIESLISMHRSAAKSLKREAVKSALLHGGMLTAIPTGFYSLLLGSFGLFDITSFAKLGVGSVVVLMGGAALVKTSHFLVDRHRMASSSLFEVFRHTKEKFVHDDFRDYYEYIEGEWADYDYDDRITVKAEAPSPLRVEEYKWRYQALRALDRGDALPGFSLAGSTSNNASSWASIRGVLNSVKQEWVEWEMDILKIVQYPALFDMREATTVDFHRALIAVESMTVESNEAYSANHPFVLAVNNFKLTWTVAMNEAERIQQSNFGVEERGRLAKAMDLLRIALNASGTPSERQASYKRAMKQLEGIVRVPANTVSTLEAGIGLKELESA